MARKEKVQSLGGGGKIEQKKEGHKEEEGGSLI